MDATVARARPSACPNGVYHFGGSHEESPMYRIVVSVSLFALTAGFLVAQDEIRRGTVKALDAEKGTITIAVNGKDATFFITGNTDVRSGGKAVAKPFEDKELKPGAEVMFKAAQKDGKDVLVGLRFGAQPKQPEQPKGDTSKLKTLPDLGT